MSGSSTIKTRPLSSKNGRISTKGISASTRNSTARDERSMCFGVGRNSTCRHSIADKALSQALQALRDCRQQINNDYCGDAHRGEQGAFTKECEDATYEYQAPNNQSPFAVEKILDGCPDAIAAGHLVGDLPERASTVKRANRPHHGQNERSLESGNTVVPAKQVVGVPHTGNRENGVEFRGEKHRGVDRVQSGEQRSGCQAPARNRPEP